MAKSGNKWLSVAICGFMWLKWFYVCHFGCPKFTFDRISGHFRSIRNFIFVWKFLTKWLPSVILDVRNSLLIVFLAISDRLALLDFLNSLSIAIFFGGHFGCPKITFDRISGHF